MMDNKTSSTLGTTHPLTAQWWQQRDTCRRCLYHTHMGQTNNRDGSLGERCSAVTIGDMADTWKSLYGRRALGPPGEMAFCIDARAEGAPCGPEASLFKLKRKTTRSQDAGR